MFLLPLLLPIATAAPFVDGERLEWNVSWMGVDAGSAWATTTLRGAQRVFQAGCWSAAWLASMYPIDDLLLSEWTPGAGSSRYTTRFREGNFNQDNDMHFAPDGVAIARSQKFEEGWRAWEDHYGGVPGLEDPVSAFQRLRIEAGPVGERLQFPVWSGRKPVPMQVWTAAAEPLDGHAALRVEVFGETSGSVDLEPKMTVWVSDDDARLPLLAVVHTRAGPVRARLTKWNVP